MAGKIIEVENLEHSFGDFKAVDNITFSVEEGEIFSFLGPNGAGKSTTVKILTTLALPTAGRASVGGYDVVTQAGEVRRKRINSLKKSRSSWFQPAGSQGMQPRERRPGSSSRPISSP